MNDILQVQNLLSIKERFTLEGKKAFVTGAAGGIGRSTAAAFAELGADVAIVDIKPKEEKAKEIAEYISKKFGVKSIAVTTDVSDPVAVDSMISQIVKAFGTIEVVHSNAGIVMANDSPEMALDEWNKMVNINLTGMFLVNRTSANVMKDSGKGGAIINTASMSATIVNQAPEGMRHAPAYCATKAAVKHFTKVMAVDYAKYNIRVNSISPGVMFSGIHDSLLASAGVAYDIFAETANFSVPMRRYGNMNEIGGIVAFLATDLASYITGADILVDGGYTVW